MSRIRDLSSLDGQVRLFADYLRDEHHYDGFTYGVVLDTSTRDRTVSSMILRQRGMSPE